MTKIEIVVPNNLKDNKLSNWPEFPQQFNPAHKKFILDKQIPGCGATTYFLENELPLILCSYRVGLLECKADSDRHIGKVHLFKRHGEDRAAYGEWTLQAFHDSFYRYQNWTTSLLPNSVIWNYAWK